MKRTPASIPLVASAVALVALCATAPARALTVNIGDMNAADWTAVNVSHTGASTLSLSAAAGGGNPGSHWQHDWQVAGTLSGDVFGDRRANIYELASYSPATEGALGTLAVSFDFSRLASTFVNGGGGFLSAAIEQGGRIFIQAIGTAEALSNDWLDHSFSSADADDWVEFGTSAHPDFSASGSTLRFGYRYSLNSICPAPANGRCSAVSATAGVDNFRVTALAQAPSTVPEPQGWALVLVALALLKGLPRKAGGGNGRKA